MADKRTPVTIGLSAATGALVAASVMALGGPASQPAPPAESHRESVPVVAAKASLAKHLAESGAQPSVTCTRGGASNEPGLFYCSDGGTAGFLLSDATVRDLGDIAEQAEFRLVRESNGDLFAVAGP